MVAAPQPPSLKLPEPVVDLTAQRTGNQVSLHWTMPKRATDKVLLAGGQKARVCRRVDSESCVVVANLRLAPTIAASFTDQLPAALVSGSTRPLVYTVEIENRSGRAAGPSNTAVTASGSAPLQPGNFQARAQAEGIVLSWVPEDGADTVRIDRTLVQPPGEQKSSNPNSSIPLQQTLEFSGRDQGRVLDHDAALDHTYTYVAQRIAKLTLVGRSVEVASAPSEPITTNARDLFPPSTPVGLQVVADAEAHAIDLSWQPDTEADLAGYSVYRREQGSSVPPERISSETQPAPSFRDSTARPGHTYEYSVSATDHDGNESSRAPEVEETLPQE